MASTQVKPLQVRNTLECRVLCTQGFSSRMSILQEICLQAVAANFAVSPSSAYLPEAHLSKLISLLSLELPLELAGTVRDDKRTIMLVRLTYKLATNIHQPVFRS